jgi:hypothetical protein
LHDRHHPAKTPARQLRVVRDGETNASSETACAQAAVRPALALWRLDRSSTLTLPSELAAKLIGHYSDPGDLVLTAPGAYNAIRQARRLDRRALSIARRTPSEATSTAEVIELRPDERADLAIAAPSDQRAPDLGQLVGRLKPGAFLVLALDHPHGWLGEVVQIAKKDGLQYWQHIVALEPGELELEPANAGRATNRSRSLRCHRDLVVFRQPARADTLVVGVAAVGGSAA